jgi:tRNA(fMet)-specific endonuclease VapC
VLDANAWIALFRWSDKGIASQLKSHEPTEIGLCAVVLGELWYGAERSESTRRAANRKRVNELLGRYAVVPFDVDAAKRYATIRTELDVAGKPIGPNDLMIAAIAKARQATVVTHNVAEFSRVPRLSVEDWQST